MSRRGRRGEEGEGERVEASWGRGGEGEQSERRDAGTCVSHGLPIATHAANARVIGASYRPRYTGCP